MTEHSRFLRIERRRADSSDPEETADRGRIAAVLDAAPPSRGADASPGDGDADGEVDEMSEGEAGEGAAKIEKAAFELAVDAAPLSHPVVRPAGEGQEIDDDVPELAIDVAAVEGQPFVRCARCGRDNTIHARQCSDCAAELDTAAQRAFNEKLWGLQRANREKEQKAIAEMAAKRQEERRHSARPLPEPGISLPPELTEAEMAPDDGPYLVEVLRALQKKQWIWAAAAAMVIVPFFLVTLGGPLLSWIGRAVVLLLVLAMLPRRLIRRVVQSVLGKSWPP